MRPLRLQVILLLLVVFTAGCASTARTERQWRTGYAALSVGDEPADVLIGLGPPRDIIPADPTAGTPETWIYYQTEPVGWKTSITGENEIPLPHGKGSVSVPVYEDQDIMKIVQYRLKFEAQRLQDWTRIIPD